MNRMLIAVLLIGTALTACTSDEIDEKVAQVQAATRAICGFVPSAPATAAILATTGNPTIVTVGGAAAAICDAIEARPMTLFGTPDKCVVEVEGVCVDGDFIDKEGP
jgi:hypothetical protein